MLKTNIPRSTRRLAGLGLSIGLAAYASAGAAQPAAAPQQPTGPAVSRPASLPTGGGGASTASQPQFGTICLTNACMPRADAATAEARGLARAARAEAYAAMAERGGLTPDESARFVANLLRLTDAYEAKTARGGPLGLSLAEVQASLGSAYGDQSLFAALLIGQGQAVPFTRPVLGVGYGVTPEGVAVTSVTPGGPAERAGLAAGDVIGLINGEPAGENTTSRDKTSSAPVVYTLTSGRVITVTPGGYVP